MVFSKDKALQRIENNGYDTYCDDTMREIFNNLDGQEAVSVDLIGDDEKLCTGKNGTCYFVKTVDCVA